MLGKANLSIMDQRRAARRRIDLKILGHHRTRGDLRFRMLNISVDGFMVAEAAKIERGDRVMIRLPVVGYMEAFCLWAADDRAGFQFERPIRASEFSDMLAMLGKSDAPTSAIASQQSVRLQTSAL